VDLGERYIPESEVSISRVRERIKQQLSVGHQVPLRYGLIKQYHVGDSLGS